jgi:hypothetical protein
MVPKSWIRIDPIGVLNQNEKYNITGTTNLPPGAEILVEGGTDNVHSCPPPELRNGSYLNDTQCGWNCQLASFNDIVHVVNSVQGNNTWVYSINTGNWCARESYYIHVASNFSENVSSDDKFFTIRKAGT